MYASVQLVIGVRVTREELFTQGMPEYRCDSGHKARTLDINQFGVVRAWPNGWCDADAEESSAILRARMERKGRR